MYNKFTLLKGIRRDRGLILLSLPAIIYIVIFNYIPLYGLILPFKDYKFSLGFLKSPWVGLDNFKFLFSSDAIFKASINTIGYNLIFIFGGAFLSVCIALMLYELGSRAVKVYQTIFFFPYFLSWAVVSYVFLALLDMDHGVLNKTIGIFGMDPIYWYSEPKYWPVILVIVAFWKGLGSGVVIYYAGLMGIDSSFYEAAKIDGASKFQQVTKISVPLLFPLITMMIILGIGRMFYSDFGMFYNVPLNSPLLYPATEVIDTFVFKLLRSMGDINISASANVYQSIVGFILVLLTNRIVKKINSELSIF